MAESKVTLPILREHWRLLDRTDTIASTDECYRWNSNEWVHVSEYAAGKPYADWNHLVIRRRVPALPTCETCEYYLTDQTPDGEKWWTFCSHELGPESLPQDGTGFCHLHSALNKAQEERG